VPYRIQQIMWCNFKRLEEDFAFATLSTSSLIAVYVYLLVVWNF
jgi:hypothetical protein